MVARTPRQNSTFAEGAENVELADVLADVLDDVLADVPADVLASVLALDSCILNTKAL